jgi:hypothetical protein
MKQPCVGGGASFSAASNQFVIISDVWCFPCANNIKQS